jgi:hypothetical protein
MPTRTERLQLNTFVAKLSKHNVVRARAARHSNKFFDNLFAKSFSAAKGYQESWPTKMKKEAMAAVNWMTYYGKSKEMLEGLNVPDLRFLGILFDLNPDAFLPNAQIENILALPDLNNESPDLDPLQYLSMDSSGTDAPAKDTGTARRRRPRHDQPAVWERMRPRRRGEGGTSGRTSGARAEAPDGSDAANAEQLGDESFSDPSSSDSPSDGQRRRQSRHQAARRRQHSDGTADDSPSDSGGSDEQEDGQRRRERHRAERAASISGGDGGSDSSAEEDPRRSRGSRRREHRGRRERSRATQSPGPRRRKDKRSTRKERPRLHFESDKDGSEEEDDSGSDELSGASRGTDRRDERRGHGKERSSGGRRRESRESARRHSRSRSQRASSSRRKRHGGDARGHSTPLVQFQTDNEDSEHGHSTSDDSMSERDEDLTRTRFQEHNRAEAATIIRACGCALCKTYSRIHRLDKTHIIRGTRAWGHTFR